MQFHISPWELVIVHTLEYIKQAVELANMRLHQSIGDPFTTDWLRHAPTSQAHR